jgi:phage gp36-like protein
VECQKHDDYQDAIKWLLSVTEEYVELGQGASEKGKESAGNIINVLRFLLVYTSSADSISGPYSSTSCFRTPTTSRALR